MAGLGSSYDYLQAQPGEVGGGPVLGGGAATAAGANPWVSAAMIGASFLSNYMENQRKREMEAQQAMANAAQTKFGNESKGLDTLLGVYSKGLLK